VGNQYSVISLDKAYAPAEPISF